MTARRLIAGTCLGVALSLAAVQSQSGSPQKPDYPIKPVPFTSVHLNDVFWAPRIETNRTASIPAAFEQCELTGRVNLFERAATVLRGEALGDKRPPGYPFDETDLYKVIEGASYSLSAVPDPRLDAYLDGLIAKIAAAQEPDGYLYTTRTIDPANPHRWAGSERWVLERDDSHELYDLGHLFEAAVAHYLATGKRTLLDVAVKAAGLLVRTFGPGKRTTWPGHQITEMALVKLYRVTGHEPYLTLAKFLLDERGPGPFPEGERANPRGLTYNQAHLRVIDQSEPVGHAVRAVYMYSGMADVAAVTGDEAMRTAGRRIWDHLITSKLYITGGIGASGSGEAFGQPYELPNMTAYNETCASVGMDFWNHRLFLLEGDAKYIDVMERTLYNGLVSGVSLDGRTFFYPNPLESNGQHARQEWFGVACCPGNITRFMPSVPGYLYATRGEALFVNLYAAGSADIELAGGKLEVVQETRYPWDGVVKLTLSPDRARRIAVKLRIPGWARDEPVASDLYRFLDKGPTASLSVNGGPVPLTLDKGYVTIDRTWQAGDAVALSLPMPVRRVVSHEMVAANRERVALQRGPIVFAAEWPDNPNGKVRNIVLPDSNPLTSEFRSDLLNGVQVIRGRAYGLSMSETGATQKAEQPFTAIPYATWANRGRGQMAVWLARRDAVARPTPYPTVATTSSMAASLLPNGQSKNPRNIIDGDEPASSADSSAYFDWWPLQGWSPACNEPPSGGRQPPSCSKGEWVEMTFAKPSTVSTSDIYWFDDTGRGGVRVPASWRLLYKAGNDWRPVDAKGPFGVTRDSWNAVSFARVTTTALRIEVVMQPGFSAGLQEWRVR
jgi:DUF1680 family protein